jgi:hypothetical protein
MINLLSIASHKSKYSSGFYPTFAIDGVPLEVWLPRQNPAAEFDLVAAHSGLYSDEDNLLNGIGYIPLRLVGRLWFPCLSAQLT